MIKFHQILQEIGINKPKSIKEKILDLYTNIGTLDSIGRMKRWEILIIFGYSRSSEPTIEMWLDTLDQRTLKDIYDKLSEIKNKLTKNGNI